MSDRGAVLIVDDDVDIRETISLLLEDEGYRILAASGGQQALARLRETRDVSVILLDLRMPDMSGPEFIKVLKEDPDLANIPVVVMSGDTAARAISASIGADACLVKPIELPVLLATAERYTQDMRSVIPSSVARPSSRT